jgi:hypothetical protein
MLALSLEHHQPAVDIILWDTLDDIQYEHLSVNLEIRVLEILSATCSRCLSRPAEYTVSSYSGHQKDAPTSVIERYTHSGIEPNDFTELQAMQHLCSIQRMGSEQRF